MPNYLSSQNLFVMKFLPKFVSNFGVEKIKNKKILIACASVVTGRQFMNKKWFDFPIESHQNS